MVTYRTHCERCKGTVPIPTWRFCVDCTNDIRAEKLYEASKKKKKKPVAKPKKRVSKIHKMLSEGYSPSHVAARFNTTTSACYAYMKAHGIPTRENYIRYYKDNVVWRVCSGCNKKIRLPKNGRCSKCTLKYGYMKEKNIKNVEVFKQKSIYIKYPSTIEKTNDGKKSYAQYLKDSKKKKNGII